MASTAVWQPSGVVTLTTDFGLVDPYVGIMHGVLLSRGVARVVDLTHGVPAQDVRTAAFHLAHSWRWFPAGTVHVAVVDPGVGSARRIVAALAAGHAFLAPDNGLLEPLLEAAGPAEVFALDVPRFALEGASRTFHGRDVFSPAAAALAGGLSPAEAGAPAGRLVGLALATPVRSQGQSGTETVAGEVLFTDRFGNLVTNVPAALVGGPLERWRAHLGGRAVPLAGTYAEVPPGRPLALVDSFGFWEVAVRDGSAARELGLAAGAAVRFERGGPE